MNINPYTFTLAGVGKSRIYSGVIEHLTITDGVNILQTGYCNPYLEIDTQGSFYIKSQSREVKVTTIPVFNYNFDLGYGSGCISVLGIGNIGTEYQEVVTISINDIVNNNNYSGNLYRV